MKHSRSIVHWLAHKGWAAGIFPTGSTDEHAACGDLLCPSLYLRTVKRHLHPLFADYFRSLNAGSAFTIFIVSTLAVLMLLSRFSMYFGSFTLR
jgi:hypothetical protein